MAGLLHLNRDSADTKKYAAVQKWSTQLGALTQAISAKVN